MYVPKKKIGVFKGSKFGKGDESHADSKAKIDAFMKAIDDLNDPNLLYSDKMDQITKIYGDLAKELYSLLLSNRTDTSIASVSGRICKTLNSMSSIFIKMRESELSDEINPHSKKFQVAFGWFLELFVDVLKENKLDDTMINNIMSSLSSRLRGWEDTIEKNLKGLSQKSLANLEANPFKFNSVQNI
jgi:hypothetical protein